MVELRVELLYVRESLVRPEDSLMLKLVYCTWIKILFF